MKYQHDGDGQVDEVTDALGHKRSTKYDANHNVDTATDAMGTGTTPGNVSDYGFNTRNNLESVESPTGGMSTTSWQTIAGGDKPKDSTNADGEKTSFTYDTAGNTKTVAQTGTCGGSVSYTYNPATPDCGGFEGQRCTAQTKMSASKTVKTSFTYDDKGNLTKPVPPKPLGETTYTYDELGRTETLIDGRGIKKVFTYDHLDRPHQGRLHHQRHGPLPLRRRRQPAPARRLHRHGEIRVRPAAARDGPHPPGRLPDPARLHTRGQRRLLPGPGRHHRLHLERGQQTQGVQGPYPCGTVQTVDVDKSSRPEKIKMTSPRGTLVDLAYTYGYGTDAKTDGGKVRTTTDAVTGMKTSYTYDGVGRFSYAAEKKGSTLNSSWQYCVVSGAGIDRTRRPHAEELPHAALPGCLP